MSYEDTGGKTSVTSVEREAPPSGPGATDPGERRRAVADPGRPAEDPQDDVHAGGTRGLVRWQPRLVSGVSIAVMVLADVLTLSTAGLAAYVGREQLLGESWGLGETIGDASVGVFAGWIIAIAVCRGYDLRLLAAGSEMLRGVIHASVFAAGIVGSFVYIAEIDLSRAFFVILFVLGPVLLVVERVVLRRVYNHLRSRRITHDAVIAVGELRQIDAISKTFRRESWLGYDIVGAITPTGVASQTSALGVPVVGAEKDLLRVVQERRPGVILFASGSTANAEDFRRTAWTLEDLDVQVIVVPALAEISADRVRMRPVAGLPLVYMDLPRARHALKWTKRAFDILASAVLLAILSPLMLVIAVVISCTDGAPPLFRQERVGRAGEGFEFLKFRTMVPDAERVLAAILKDNPQDRGNAVMFKMRNDPRITAPGRVLRRYSLDELPQLWNVLRGDMSLVGPRPALPSEVIGYDGDAHRRNSVRPGITGLWQVSGRSDLSWEDTLRLDLYYVDNWSFTQDLLILLRTVRAVLTSSGAY